MIRANTAINLEGNTMPGTHGGPSIEDFGNDLPPMEKQKDGPGPSVPWWVSAEPNDSPDHPGYTEDRATTEAPPIIPGSAEDPEFAPTDDCDCHDDGHPRESSVDSPDEAERRAERVKWMEELFDLLGKYMDRYRDLGMRAADSDDADDWANLVATTSASIEMFDNIGRTFAGCQLRATTQSPLEAMLSALFATGVPESGTYILDLSCLARDENTEASTGTMPDEN